MKRNYNQVLCTLESGNKRLTDIITSIWYQILVHYVQILVKCIGLFS